MPDELQKAAAQAIVNIFETGKAQGAYDAVTVLRGDSGHLTYGRSQTTLGSGNLHKLLRSYLDLPGAALADDLTPYFPRLAKKDFSLDRDMPFKALLRQAAADPLMRAVQDRFFDEQFWQPALRAATGLGLAEALSVTVVYDSTVHGSFRLIRDRVRPVSRLGERGWVLAYLAARKSWLGSHSNPVLRRCTYRMMALQGLAAAGNWNLSLPLTVRGVVLTAEALSGPAEEKTVSGPTS
ncbi:MAG: chitosanase [Parvibaculaceae bacterium]|nr:chitosanase [Parvibaculaceae bacterium]